MLVVEDDHDIRDVLEMILEAEGYHMVGAENGRDAPDRLKNGPHPCLILLNLMMPVMNGWQFRAEQAQDPGLAAIPVVVISADHKVSQNAAALRAAAYLKKPIDFDELLETLERYC